MSAVVTIVRTGVANTASVSAALRRCGCARVLSDSAREIERAALLVLPGVGSFGAGMESLRAHGLVGVLRERIAVGRPTLAVCLGLQLLCEASEESPGVTGLEIVPARVTRFGEGVRRPQFGWNRVEVDPACGTLAGGYAYFANSYRLTEVPPGWVGATAEHGGRFVAAIERGPVVGCQFHPELSGPWGIDLIGRWLANAREASTC